MRIEDGGDEVLLCFRFVVDQRDGFAGFGRRFRYELGDQSVGCAEGLR